MAAVFKKIQVLSKNKTHMKQKHLPIKLFLNLNERGDQARPQKTPKKIVRIFRFQF